MEKSRYRSRNSSSGFTLLEVMFAIIILAVALLGLALLMMKVASGTERARYMSVAATLASEKLEDMSRYPSVDPAVFVPASSVTVGSLTADTSQVITAPSSTEAVYYYDDVEISTGGGEVREVINTKDRVTGNPCYYVFTHSAKLGTASDKGCVASAPDVGPDTLVFHRRWLIESPVVVNTTSVEDIRRITVLVTLPTALQGGKVSFQMSAVRP